MGARQGFASFVSRRRAVLALAGLALAGLALVFVAGCSLMDYAPWPGSGGGGHPASTRRNRAGARPEEPPQSSAQEPEYQVEEGPSAFNALSRTDAQRLARRLDPRSQSLQSFAGLAEPLRQSLAHLTRQPQDAPALVQPAGQLTYGQLRQSAQELLDLLPRLDADPGLLAERFVWYELAPEPLVTGYYSPQVEARLAREPGFETPLYAVPPDLHQASAAELRQGRPRAYRVVGGTITQYYDRRAIDLNGVLAGQGLEIAWVKSPLDAFLLQTEGAGVLLLPDGRRFPVQFAAGNGLEFKGLGQLLLASKALPKEKLSRESIRAWCAENPGRALQLMAENRSYVFFELRQGPSAGALEKPLTALVSLATDPRLLPLGAVAALDCPLPAEPGGVASSLRGLVLAQDTGADIQGSRLDLYLGVGERAERLESGLRTTAGLHLLVSKNALRAKHP